MFRNVSVFSVPIVAYSWVHDSQYIILFRLCLAFSRVFFAKASCNIFCNLFPAKFSAQLLGVTSGAADGAAASLFEGSHDDPSVERAPQRENRLPRDRAGGEG